MLLQDQMPELPEVRLPGRLPAGDTCPDLRTHVPLAFEHAADGDQNCLARLLLRDVTAGAGSEGAFGVDGCIIQAH